jgi:hypothetical protein
MGQCCHFGIETTQGSHALATVRKINNQLISFHALGACVRNSGMVEADFLFHKPHLY